MRPVMKHNNKPLIKGNSKKCATSQYELIPGCNYEVYRFGPEIQGSTSARSNCRYDE